jgi:[acyl-carrier-protein] S-malonyltransferase
MIHKAYKEILQITESKQYGMGTVIGLNREDIIRIIDANFNTIEVTNQNSAYSFVLSGTYDEIIKMVEIVRDAGALHTRLIKVSVPYHSQIIRGIEKKFRQSLSGIVFLRPHTRIISLVDQSVLQDEESLKEEVIRNLFTHLNWYKTQLKLQDLGISRFLECGPGKGLAKNAKFIPGDFIFFDSKSYLKLKEFQKDMRTSVKK